MFNTEVRGALAVDVLGTLAHGPVVPPGPPAAHLHSDDQDRIQLIYWTALSMYPNYPRMLSGWNAKRKGAFARFLRSHPINQYKPGLCLRASIAGNANTSLALPRSRARTFFSHKIHVDYPVYLLKRYVLVINKRPQRGHN